MTVTESTHPRWTSLRSMHLRVTCQKTQMSSWIIAGTSNSHMSREPINATRRGSTSSRFNSAEVTTVRESARTDDCHRGFLADVSRASPPVAPSPATPVTCVRLASLRAISEGSTHTAFCNRVNGRPVTEDHRMSFNLGSCVSHLYVPPPSMADGSPRDRAQRQPLLGRSRCWPFMP